MEPVLPDYVVGGSSSAAPRQRSASRERPKENASSSSIHGHLTQMMWEAGSKQVKDTFNSYGRIDLFRPYFDVDPKQVRNRLIQSLIPRKPSQMTVSNDMYGPLMLIFTLVALLLYTMKSSGYALQDGTLIGTAFVTCFGYWIATSVLLYTMCYMFSCDVLMVQIFSLLGYALFGHCIVILFTALFHPVHSHLFFYGLMIAFAFPSCARVAIFVASKTRDRGHKLTMALAIFFVHLTFLTYLHFGFHTIVEEMEQIFGETGPTAQMLQNVVEPGNILSLTSQLTVNQ